MMIMMMVMVMLMVMMMMMMGDDDDDDYPYEEERSRQSLQPSMRDALGPDLTNCFRTYESGLVEVCACAISRDIDTVNILC